MEKEENHLGTEKIQKLIKMFAIPAVISLVVNSLYNIVDQIFIGWGVGYLGNGATNIVFPLTMICLAFSLAFGDGAAAYLSLKLGQQKKKEASRGVGNGVVSSIAIALILCIIALFFMPEILNIFGCTEALRKYALKYGYVITIGLPFMMIGTTLNSIIRADGNPKYAMTSMIIGAILNIILDPIFIFVLKMGVEGAAIATVISQILTFIMNIAYLKKMKTIKLTTEDFKIKPNITKKIALLGVSSFITQLSIVIVIAVQNNLLGKYGSSSKFGTEIPITVLGIVMKINQILNSIIIGIAAGTQPIIGYNYGAGKYDRVKETLKIGLIINVLIGIIAFILFQTIPNKLISIFGSGDKNYMEFACLTFRVYLLLCICNAVQTSAGIFFQAMGKSVKSAFLSLSRQIIILIPALIILGNNFGLNGILYAGPVADAIAFLIATILLIYEVKNFNTEKKEISTQVPEINKKTKIEDSIIITIGREYGSGGRYIGKLVAEKLGIELYDKEFIKKVAEKTGLTEEYIEESEQKRTNLEQFNSGYYIGLTNADELFINESKIIKDLASKSSCVLVGRCADFVLEKRKDILKIFIYSSMEDKIKRATKYYGRNKKTAKKEIEEINKLRANHYKYYTEKVWNDTNNYDICINSDALGVEKSADLICEIALKKIEEQKK